MFEFKEDKKKRFTYRLKNESLGRDFIAINANSSLDESWNHTMDLKTIDISNISQAVSRSRNQYGSQNMSVLDMHYDSMTYKNHDTSMNREGSQLDLAIHVDSMVTDPDKNS